MPNCAAGRPPSWLASTNRWHGGVRREDDTHGMRLFAGAPSSCATSVRRAVFAVQYSNTRLRAPNSFTLTCAARAHMPKPTRRDARYSHADVSIQRAAKAARDQRMRAEIRAHV